MNDLELLHAARSPRRCRRHEWERALMVNGDGQEITGVRCGNCNKPKSEAVSRRSRNNRKRGATWERDAAADIGGRRMGQLNLPWDVEVPAYARIQTKVLDRWPSLNKVVEWLDDIGAGDKLRIVALKDTPGPGGKARKLAVIDWDEYCKWHGRAA